MTGFGRSNSLSINTGSGSLFGSGSTNTATQSAGLFGASTNNAQPPASALLFGTGSQPQQQTGGSLFGGSTMAQPAHTGGGLFGQQASQPQQQQTGGLFSNLNQQNTQQSNNNIFGQSTAQSQPQQGGGLFGGAFGQQNQQNQNTSQSGGLFSQSQSQKPSLFGSTQQTAAAPSLFGTSTQQQQTSNNSLFGGMSTQPQQQQQQQQSSLFGGMASQNKPMGGLSLGGHTVNGPGQSNQQTLQIDDPSRIKGTTRYSDLNPQLQSTIEAIDNQIQLFIKQSQQTRETLIKNGEKIVQIAPDVKYIEEYLAFVELGIDNDSTDIASLKDLCKKDSEDAMLSFRAIENLKLPSQYHYGNNMSGSRGPVSMPPGSSPDDSIKPVDLVGYFNKRSDDLGSTLNAYQQQIREIEAHLRTMEDGTQIMAQELMGNNNKVRDQRRELVQALQAIEGAILQAATKVGETRDLVVRQTVGRGMGV